METCKSVIDKVCRPKSTSFLANQKADNNKNLCVNTIVDLFPVLSRSESRISKTGLYFSVALRRLRCAFAISQYYKVLNLKGILTD